MAKDIATLIVEEQPQLRNLAQNRTGGPEPPVLGTANFDHLAYAAHSGPLAAGSNY